MKKKSGFCLWETVGSVIDPTEKNKRMEGKIKIKNKKNTWFYFLENSDPQLRSSRYCPNGRKILTHKNIQIVMDKWISNGFWYVNICDIKMEKN